MQADPAGYGGPPGTRVVGEGMSEGTGSVVSRGDDHEVLKVICTDASARPRCRCLMPCPTPMLHFAARGSVCTLHVNAPSPLD